MEKQEVDFDNIFMFIMEAMVKSSEGKLRIAYQEKNKSNSLDEETGYFLKMNNERIGKDIEIYISMSKNLKFYGLPDFFMFLQKIKKDCPESYGVGSEMLQEVGNQVFDGKILKNWNKMFKKTH